MESELPTPRGASRVLRLWVYAMLVASALAAFLSNDRLWTMVREGQVPGWLPLVAPSLFAVFVVVYTVDRFRLVQRHGYPAGRAFFQVAFAVVFLSLLWPQQAQELFQPRDLDGTTPSRLLDHRDSIVRAAGCELAAYRGDTAVLDQVRRLAQEDSSAAVQQACRAASERLGGVLGLHE